MAGIWNVNNAYNANLKKVSSKLSFQLGETFSARVVNYKQENGEASIKLLDGWQFPAKIENPQDYKQAELSRFQVVGFEEGKLKLKVVSSKKENEDTEDNSIDNILAENNIDDEEYGILEKMVKHNMPLTKENISKIKSLNDFMSKLKQGTDEEDSFINKYLGSKNIDPQSVEGKEIRETLKKFFTDLKKLSIDDVMILMENNIDLNSENIESFNKIFNGSMEIYKELSEFGKVFDNENREKILNMIVDSINEYTGEGLELSQEIMDALPEDLSNERAMIRQIVDGKIELNHEDVSSIAKLFETKAEKIFKESNLAENLEIPSQSKAAEKIQDMPFKGIIGSQFSSYNSANSLNLIKSHNILDMLKSISQNNDELKSSLEEIITNNKENLGEKRVNVFLGKLEGFNDEKIVSLFKNIVGERASKEGISEIFNNEGLNTSISKDDFEELFGKLLGASIKLSDEEIKTLTNTINKIFDGEIEKSGKVLFEDMLNSKDKKSSELVKDQIRFKTDELKSIIKDILVKSSDMKPENYNKIAEMIRNNTNDFKVFNSMSNQYYYMDMPLNIKDTEYPCKLIIKDERKQGKKIDSKNVKLVMSVKTVNMGVVDGYIKVRDNNMNIDIKCNKEWIKVFDIGKEKLVQSLSGLGFNLNVHVEKREEEVSLTNCREFFEDSSINNINVKV